MIRVGEAEFSTDDVRRVEKQIRLLEQKVAENHWKTFATRTCITIAAGVAVFMATQSLRWSLVPLIAGGVWAAAALDSMSTQKMQRIGLALAKDRLVSPKKAVITVEDCDYIDYGEIEDEGALFLFSDDSGNWLMLEGQEYYETDTFPSKSFRLSYDSQGALLEIESDAPFLERKQLRDASLRREQELFFGGFDHSIVQASDEDEAFVKLRKLAARANH